MKTVFLVKQEEADVARHMESKLLSLPLSSGILFVGVSVLPETDTSPTLFRIWVGCHRDFDEALMDVLVRHTLHEEITKGARIKVEAHRGISRSPVAKVVDASK